MKTRIMLLTTLALITSGCNVKPNDDMKKETDEIIKKSQQDIDELTSSLYRGGQPGKITVKGVVIKNTQDGSEIDERLSISQIGGKGNRGVSQVLVSEKNKAELTETATSETLSKISDSKSYINMGCSDLNSADIEGLTEEIAKPLTDSVLSISAKKIFICGSHSITQSFVTISADQILFYNAKFSIQSAIGSLSVLSNELIVEGKNSLKTSGVDMTINVLEAPSLDLLVRTQLRGEGTLSLESIGGNCVQKDEKK